MSFHYDDPLEMPQGAEDFARCMAGAVCWVPHRLTAREFGDMPLIEGRRMRDAARLLFGLHAGKFRSNPPEGWGIACINGLPDDGFRLGELALLPEWCVGLAEPGGPMQPFLMYHAQEVYGLSFNGPVDEPDGYGDIRWSYLPYEPDPKAHFGRTLYRMAQSKSSKRRQIAIRLATYADRWNAG